MFTLTFPKSGSKQYSNAILIAEKIGGTLECDLVTIELSDLKLLCSYNDLCDLLRIVYKWKGVEATYKGKEVDPFKFVFKTWRNLNQCSVWKYGSRDTRHCWKDNDSEGWGCKYLTPFRRELTGGGEYQKSNLFFYNYGHLEGFIWKIDKNVIFDRLVKFAQSSHLFLCPHFAIQRVKDIVDSLPDSIPIDGVNFRPFKKDFRTVNVRHAPSHFAFNDRMVINRPSHYADMCLINYLAHAENKLTFYEISQN